MTAARIDQGALDRTISLLEGLTRTYRQGRIYQEGAGVAIAGATNSGKSSLFNAILRQERAIVSEVHGTTRDWLEGTVSLEGIPVRLFDTAGLRRTSDPLEAEGMRRTGQVLQSADCVIYLVDSTRGMDDEDRAFLSRHSGVPLIRAWNKVDLPESRGAPEGFMPLSATTGLGLEKLEAQVAATALGGSAAESGEPLIDSVRQRDLIGRALAALGRLREARARGVHGRPPCGGPGRCAGRAGGDHRRGHDGRGPGADVRGFLRGEIIMRDRARADADFDAIVIGGGHAGIEASLALARLGFSTLLVTQSLDCIGRMSCNPAIGGIAKGNLVREIDALGGQMAKLIDATMIQFRMLNASRGPAVQAPRAQADKQAYAALAKRTLEKQNEPQPFPGHGGRPRPGRKRQASSGACSPSGDGRIIAPAVVLTTGTFMEGQALHRGVERAGGRLGGACRRRAGHEPSPAGLHRGQAEDGDPRARAGRSLDSGKDGGAAA